MLVSSADGSVSKQQIIDKNGGFVFPGLPLQANAANAFVLRVNDAQKCRIAEHQITIRRQAGAIVRTSLAGFESNMLAKPISIMTITGLHTVAPEKTPLPFTCRIQAETIDQKGEVQVPIFEEARQIGEIIVQNVPPHVAIGSGVEIML